MIHYHPRASLLSIIRKLMVGLNVQSTTRASRLEDPSSNLETVLCFEGVPAPLGLESEGAISPRQSLDL